jgi:hypothetical protein
MLMAMNLAPGHNEALITPTELALLHDGLFEVLYQQLNPTKWNFLMSLPLLRHIASPPHMEAMQSEDEGVRDREKERDRRGSGP